MTGAVTMDVFIFMAVFLIFVLLGVLFLIPTSKKAKGARVEKGRREESAPGKDWQEASLKLEKHIHALRRAVGEHEKREKVLEKELEIQREKVNKLQEKLVQERGWQEKETKDVQKRGLELQQVRAHLQEAEKNFSQEHAVRLGLEREARETQVQMASLSETKRDLEAENARLRAQLDSCRKEILDLKSENVKLAKRHDEETWVAKSEYVRLENQVRVLEKELGKLRQPG